MKNYNLSYTFLILNAILQIRSARYIVDQVVDDILVIFELHRGLYSVKAFYIDVIHGLYGVSNQLLVTIID